MTGYNTSIIDKKKYEVRFYTDNESHYKKLEKCMEDLVSEVPILSVDDYSKITFPCRLEVDILLRNMYLALETVGFYRVSDFFKAAGIPDKRFTADCINYGWTIKDFKSVRISNTHVKNRELRDVIKWKIIIPYPKKLNFKETRGDY